jgi:tritrans,polycis-undecaprenyl-diphosphate synthase [geranylgeranyl-diphosphate specific]
MENLFEELKKTANGQLPKHVGIVPDGNRRWARKNNMNIHMGHLAGYEKVKKILYNLFDAGIKYLTIYALSLENARKRSKEELNYIFKIIKIAVDTVKNEEIVKKEKVRFNVIGRIWLLPPDVKEKIDELIEYTKNHDNRFINLCIMYDGQEEIVDAVKDIIKDGLNPEEIDRERIKHYLYTKNFPELDFLIRTGMNDGSRLSGFLLWDASYAEFRFRNDLWPDYSEEMLLTDLKDYISRNRRKGE